MQNSCVPLLTALHESELCRDFERSRCLLSGIWPDIRTDPDLSGFTPDVRARLRRYAGFFLSSFGKAKGKADFQIRGKALLDLAINWFTDNGFMVEAAEAECYLALCYWYEGSFLEAEAYFENAEHRIKDEPLEDVLIQIRLNKILPLHAKGDFPAAVQIIEEISPAMEFCQDLRLRAMFHNQAALSYRGIGFIEETVRHYSIAGAIAQESKNPRFAAVIANNFGYFLMSIGYTQEAHAQVLAALNICSGLNDRGWFGSILETQAQIFLSENRLDEALHSINQAVSLLRQGEDKYQLCEAMFVKVMVLGRLGQVALAVRELADLVQIADHFIGAVASNKYTQRFAEATYFVNTSLPFPEASRAFKKHLLSGAITSADKKLTKAAERLGISHQALSKMIKDQFPELPTELDIKTRHRRSRIVCAKLKRPRSLVSK